MRTSEKAAVLLTQIALACPAQLFQVFPAGFTAVVSVRLSLLCIVNRAWKLLSPQLGNVAAVQEQHKRKKRLNLGSVSSHLEV